MLCLELMTGERPYSHCARDVYVAMELLQGRLPERPGEPAVSRGLDDALWDIMLHCWKKPPVERPTMTKIKEMLRSIPHGPSPSPGGCPDSHAPAVTSLTRCTSHPPGYAHLTQPRTGPSRTSNDTVITAQDKHSSQHSH